MKTTHSVILYCFFLLINFSCKQQSNDHEEHGHNHQAEEIEKGPTQKLYDEVMEIHDEVMPKMDDIYKLKEDLKKQLTDAPNMVEERKKEIEALILELDSASESMMVWMRNFNPLPDSLGEEQARQYLEEQKKKVEKVKEDMLDAIEKAKDADD